MTLALLVVAGVTFSLLFWLLHKAPGRRNPPPLRARPQGLGATNQASPPATVGRAGARPESPGVAAQPHSRAPLIRWLHGSAPTRVGHRAPPSAVPPPSPFPTPAPAPRGPG